MKHNEKYEPASYISQYTDMGIGDGGQALFVTYVYHF